MTIYENETSKRDDGTQRKVHYGSGRQPWDDIKAVGWGPAFAAGHVLKYLRRSKDVEHSLESARWYWAELNKEASMEDPGDPTWDGPAPWSRALDRLINLLTVDEQAKLQ